MSVIRDTTRNLMARGADVTASPGTHNFPTVSIPEAMKLYADSRNAERDTLLDHVRLQPGMAVLDIQAAGGYLSDEVYRRLGGKVTNICVEPNPELRARLNPVYRIIDNPVEHFYSIPDQTIDVALGLIGLHHSNSHTATLGEAFRVLKPGGELAMCDVVEGSRLALWLNEFVREHCPGGHDGNFPAAGSMAHICRSLGFAEVGEQIRDVPWIFRRRKDIAIFFRGLFALETTLDRIDEALDQYFTIEEATDHCKVGWQLAYCHARKPV